MTERYKMNLTHLTFGQADVVRIAAAQRCAMSSEVLWSCEQSLRLVALYPRASDFRNQYRVFTKCFLTTSPTCILSHIKHRRPRLHSSGSYSLITNNHSSSLRQFFIKRRTQSYCLRENCRTAAIRKAVDSLHFCNRRHIQMRYARYAPSLAYQLHFILWLHHTKQALYTLLDRQLRIHIRQVCLIALTVCHLFFRKHNRHLF